MSIVVSDPDLVERLTAAGAAKLQDASGRPIGRFFTEEEFRRMVFEWAEANISTGELDAALREGQGSTLQEIWKRLGA
jgi:hypothetical protein